MITAIPFLLVVGLALPLVAWLSYRHAPTADGEPAAAPSLRALAVQTFVIQGLVGGLALLALRGAGPSLAWRSALTPVSVLSALAILLAFLVLAWLEAQTPLGPRDVLRRRLRQVGATDPVWISVALVAGFVEEFAYRGVLVALLAEPLGSWPAILVSAVLFGAAHLAAGWRAGIASMGFGLAMQGLVLVSGGLLLAVVTHAAYDLVVAWLGHRLAQRAAAGETA